MMAKIASRIEKMEHARSNGIHDDDLRLFEATIQRSKQVIEIIRDEIDVQIRKIQQVDEQRLIETTMMAMPI